MYLLKNQIMLKKKMLIIGLVAQLIVSNIMYSTNANAATTTTKITNEKSTSKKSTGKKETTVKVLSKNLSIRRGSSKKQKVIAKVKKGTELTVYGKVTSSWVKVEYKGKVGYVLNTGSKYLKEVSTTNAEDKAIENVIQAIKNIGSKVTLADKAQVKKARAAYKKLSSSAKKKVTNLSKLKKAEEKIASLEKNNEKENVEIPLVDGDRNNAEVAVPPTAGENNDVEAVIPPIAGENNDAEAVIPPTAGENNDVEAVIPPTTGDNNGVDSVNPPTLGGDDNAGVVIPPASGGNDNVEPIIPPSDKVSKKAKELSDKISQLNKEISLTDKAYIESVRKEYSSSDEEVKKYVTNITILEQAEAKLLHLMEYAKAEKSVELYLDALNKLPVPSQVKLSDKTAVVLVRNQYDQLTSLAKEMISQEANQKLIDIENVIKALEIKEQDEANALYVEGLIKQLDKTIIYQDIQMIREAREQYNNLSSYAKSLIRNLEILEKAENALAEKLERVYAVYELINKIPEQVTLEDKPYLVSVRMKYEQLSDDEKKAISKYELSILIFSEERIQRLETISNHEVLRNFSMQVKSLPTIEEVSIQDKERILELKNQYYLIDESLRFAVGEEFTYLVNLELQIKILESQQ